MMRSFQYAAYSALWQPAMRKEDVPFLEHWADLWYRQMSGVFLQSYLTTCAGRLHSEGRKRSAICLSVPARQSGLRNRLRVEPSARLGLDSDPRNKTYLAQKLRSRGLLCSDGALVSVHGN